MLYRGLAELRSLGYTCGLLSVHRLKIAVLSFYRENTMLPVRNTNVSPDDSEVLYATAVESSEQLVDQNSILPPRVVYRSIPGYRTLDLCTYSFRERNASLETERSKTKGMSKLTISHRTRVCSKWTRSVRGLKYASTVSSGARIGLRFVSHWNGEQKNRAYKIFPASRDTYPQTMPVSIDET